MAGAAGVVAPVDMLRGYVRDAEIFKDYPPRE
jgi:hypothetical protein